MRRRQVCRTWVMGLAIAVAMCGLTPDAQACDPCEVAAKIKSIKQRAAAALLAGDANKSENLENQAQNKYMSAKLKLDAAEASILDGKLADAGIKIDLPMPPITSGGILVDPVPAARYAPITTGDVIPGGPPTTVKVYVSGNAIGTNCTYAVTLRPSGLNPIGFFISHTNAMVTITNRQVGCAEFMVSASGVAAQGDSGLWWVDVVNTKTGGKVPGVSDRIVVDAVDSTPVPVEIVQLELKSITPFVPIANGGSGVLAWTVSNLTGSAQTFKAEIGPILDPLSRDTLFDPNTNAPPSFPVPDAFPNYPGPTGTPLPDATPGSFTIDVTIPPGGQANIDVPVAGQDLCKVGMIGCCPFKLRSLVSPEIRTNQQYLYNTTVTDSSPTVLRKLALHGTPRGFGDVSLEIGATTTTCPVIPGMDTAEIMNTLAETVNTNLNRLTDTSFPFTALYDFNALGIANAQPGQASLSMSPMIPGLTIIKGTNYQDLAVLDAACVYYGGTVFAIDAEVKVDTGGAPPTEAVATRLVINGAQALADQIIAVGNLVAGLNIITQRFFTPLPIPDADIFVEIDPHGLHVEGSGNHSNNSLFLQHDYVQPEVPIPVDPLGLWQTRVKAPSNYGELILQSSSNLVDWLEYLRTNVPASGVLISTNDLGTGKVFVRAGQEQPPAIPDVVIPPGPPVFFFQEVFHPTGFTGLTDFAVQKLQVPPFVDVQVNGFQPLDLNTNGVVVQLQLFLPGAFLATDLFGVYPLHLQLDPLGPGALPLPPDPSIQGLELHFQALVIDPVAPPP